MVVSLNKNNKHMDKTDIKYALELIGDAILTKEWDNIYDVKDFLLEFLDNDNKEE